MKTIFITGIAGFIGSHLMRKLKENHHVSGIDNFSTTASKSRIKLLEDVRHDDIQSNFLDQTENKPDFVIHLAAETGIPGSLNNPAKYFEQNVKGTFNVLEQCRKNGVKYLIYASSSSVYEPNQDVMHEHVHDQHQLSFYGTSKRMTELMIENYCRQFGMIAIGLRFFTVYGSWTRTDMAAYKFMENISKELPVTLYEEGNIYRDFTHVSDIVNSIERLIDKIEGEEIGTHFMFNIGNGKPIAVKTYAELIAQHLEKPLLIESKPLPSNELKSTHASSEKLQQYINYIPNCTIEKGIEEMTTWYKEANYSIESSK